MIHQNIYRFSFKAKCPADGAMIVYTCEIASIAMIRVELINKWRKSMEQGFHEDIADLMSKEFGGDQKIEAMHQGVSITTLRCTERLVQNELIAQSH